MYATSCLTYCTHQPTIYLANTFHVSSGAWFSPSSPGKFSIRYFTVRYFMCERFFCSTFDKRPPITYKSSGWRRKTSATVAQRRTAKSILFYAGNYACSQMENSWSFCSISCSPCLRIEIIDAQNRRNFCTTYAVKQNFVGDCFLNFNWISRTKSKKSSTYRVRYYEHLYVNVAKMGCNCHLR